MRIIGIDPGTATTGFSILEINDTNKVRLINYGCIKTDSHLPQNQRLQQIAKDMEELIEKYKPERASVEKLYFQNNIKTAISVAEARGVIIQKLAEKGIETEEYTPLEIKSSVCGYGKADKKMVQQMLKIIFELQTEPKPDDAADAVAAALCLANSYSLKEKIAQAT